MKEDLQVLLGAKGLRQCTGVKKLAMQRTPRGQNGLKLMTLQAIFNHFYLDFCPSDDADRQVSTCSIQWCKKTCFENPVAYARIVLGPSNKECIKLNYS